MIDDLAYYVFHRSAHRVRWFWASHVIHHSSQHYNLSTALRQTWTGFLSIAFIFRLPLFLIGFPPAMVFFVAGLNLIYQFWIHTEAIDRMPRWFEAVMNTPSHHRVHHATNARYLDRNYAGVFIVWDRMFGTFEPETEAETHPLWPRQQSRQLQRPLGGGPRVGRHRARRVARAVAAQAQLYHPRARLEPRWLARHERHHPGRVARKGESMTDQFDVIVIGGGSAGSAVAARLSEDPKLRVCLLEAGGDNDDWRVKTPGMMPFIPDASNYRYETVPQPGLNGRTGYQPRGRGLGGSSAINAMVYIRGNAWDYDNWAAIGLHRLGV